MIELLLTVSFVILIGLSGGVITHWISSLIGNPERQDVNTRAIFAFYGVWIKQKYEAFEKRLADNLTRKDFTIKQEEMYIARNLNFWMSAGCCPKCMSVWVTAIISIIVFALTGVSLWWVFFALPFSSITLRWMMDNDYEPE